MYTTPSPDDLLEGVVISLQNDIMPAITNPRAQATVAMMQAVIQQVRQTLPRYQEYLTDEHNEMTKVFRDVAATLGTTAGPAAESVRRRAQELGGKPDLPKPVDNAELMAAHRACSQGILDTIRDLDVLQRAGNANADAALERVRAHLGPRYARDVATVIPGAGMIGRG
jgi:hypothetical protein